MKGPAPSRSELDRCRSAAGMDGDRKKRSATTAINAAATGAARFARRSRYRLRRSPLVPRPPRRARERVGAKAKAVEPGFQAEEVASAISGPRTGANLKAWPEPPPATISDVRAIGIAGDPEAPVERSRRRRRAGCRRGARRRARETSRAASRAAPASWAGVVTRGTSPPSGLAVGPDLVHRDADAVVGDLHDALAGEREAVVAGARDVGAEHGEVRRLERRRIGGAEVEHGLADGAQRAGERGQGGAASTSRRRRRRDRRRARLLAGPTPASAGGGRVAEAIDRAALPDGDAARARAGRRGSPRRRRTRPSRRRGGGSRRRARRGRQAGKRRAISAASRRSMRWPRAGERGEAVVLEAAGRHRGSATGTRRRSRGRAARATRRSSGASPRWRASPRIGVVEVGAVVAAHDLRDVGGLGERVRHAARGRRASTSRPRAAQLERGGDAEDAAADHGDAHHGALGPAARCGPTGRRDRIRRSASTRRIPLRPGRAGSRCSRCAGTGRLRARSRRCPAGWRDPRRRPSRRGPRGRRGPAQWAGR